MNTFLNLTCISLIIHSKKSYSPLFSFANSNHKSFISIQNSVFSKIYSPIIQSHYSHSYFFINSCCFSRIINSVLVFEESTFNQKEFHSRMIFKDETFVFITNCKFNKIDLANENKSAIISFIPININNSLFRKINGGDGSCINSNSSLILKYTTCDHNIGENGGCFYLNSNSIHDTSIKYSLFYQNIAKYSSLFYRNSLGDLIISKCNISNCEATECVGVFENAGAYFHLDYTLFEKCKAKAHYGCIMIKEPLKLLIEKCTFVEIKHQSNLRFTASAIFISNGKNSNQIAESEFINCINKETFTISYQNCQSLTIYKCMFTDGLFQSLNPQMPIPKIDCQFNVNLNYPTAFLKNKIGFGAKQDLKSENVDNLKNELNKKRFNLMLRNISIRFVISFVFAFLIASVINYFHNRSGHAFRSKSRRERL